jgi:hypothetical protein
MSQTSSSFIDYGILCSKTAFILGRQGHERHANAVHFCRRGYWCNHRSLCPRCSRIRASRRTDRYSAAVAAAPEGLHWFAFTSVGMNTPIQALRCVAGKELKYLAHWFESKSCIAGSLLVSETIPSKSDDTPLDTEFVHCHGLVALSDVDSRQARLFLTRLKAKMQHFERVTQSYAAGWPVYALKAQHTKFADHWSQLLSVPANLVPRSEQLNGFQPVRTSGVLAPASRRKRAASLSRVLTALQPPNETASTDGSGASPACPCDSDLLGPFCLTMGERCPPCKASSPTP